VIIVGGGPVGLTLAHILEEHQVPWLLIEPRAEPDEHSRAIGVAPPTQEIFDRIGVLPEIERAGLPIRHALIHGDGAWPGIEGKGRGSLLDFEQLEDNPSCIISIPQKQTETILRASLSRRAPDRLWCGYRAVSAGRNGRGVCVEAESVTRREGTGRVVEVHADYLCGCDGVRSLVRESLIGRGRDYRYPQRFVMGDFRDQSGLGEEAHLYFTRTGSVEAFPLPGGVRRWIVQTDRYYRDPPPGLLARLVRERAGYDLDERECTWRSSFRIRRSFAAAMANPPVFLAGDAAHTVPPIGGQGMNLGIGDAEHLGDMLASAYWNGEPSAGQVAGYQRRRVTSATHAGVLSVFGMRVGTIQGPIAGRVRDGVLRALLKSGFSRRFMREFAMVAAPYSRSPWRRDYR
jgi:2-polyprenyl-6-methoxyphenol hydroxylase-like FAD-dependent oxidoreductase